MPALIGPESLLASNYRILVNFLVIGCVAFFAVDATMRFVSAAFETSPVVTVSAGAAQPSGAVRFKPFGEYQKIVQRNLFGDAALKKAPVAPPPPPVVSVAELPKANPALNLQLFGTVVDADPRKSVAFVLDKGANNDGTYHVGDNIKTVQVRKIERFFIIVNSGGQDSVLWMDIAQPDAGLPKEAVPGSAGPNRPRPWPIRRAPWSPAGDIQASMSNLDKVMKEARFTPVVNDGKASGYRVSAIKPDSIYSKLSSRTATSSSTSTTSR
jgi:type II secretory pathway component PulC